MPLSHFINFAQLPTQDNGYGDLLGKFMEGYRASQEPENMRISQNQQRGLLEQLLLGNENQRTANEFQRPGLVQGQREKEADILGKEINNQYAPTEKEQKIAYQELINKLYPQAQQADIGLKNAQANSYGMTADQRELAQLFGSGSPQYNKAMMAKHGIHQNRQGGYEGLPEGARSLAGAPANDRNRVYSTQIKEIEKIQNLKNAYAALDEAKKIIEKHPNIASTAAAIMVNPGEKKFTDKALRLLLKGKDLEAAEKLDKIFSNVVLQMGSSMGAKGFTDMRQRLISQAKGSVANTDEANKFIIDSMQKEIYPEIAYEKDLKKALGDYELPFYRENYPNSPQENKSGRMITLRNKSTGETEEVSEEEARKRGAIK